MPDCRRKPPPELCKVCREVNNGCKTYCRDVFVYDGELSDEEIIETLRDDYVIGGKGGWRVTPLVIPERILGLLEQPEAPYAQSARLVRRLAINCECHGAMVPGEQCNIADYAIVWDPVETLTFKLSNHTDKQHTYVELHQNGDISISLAALDDQDLHELWLPKGKEPVYHYESGIPGTTFPEERFIRWVEEAIKALQA